MKTGVRNLVVLLVFLLALMLLVASRSKPLGLFLALGFYAMASAIVVVRTLRRKPGDSYLRQGWGNPLSVLPRRWQDWLTGEYDPAGSSHR